MAAHPQYSEVNFRLQSANQKSVRLLMSATGLLALRGKICARVRRSFTSLRLLT
jgi:hypothetical protein